MSRLRPHLLVLLLTAGPALAEDEPAEPPEPHEVSLAEVKAIHRVAPEMPKAARSMDFDELRCQLRFFIDEQGVPYDVKPEDCPELFHASALEAAYQWRFTPMEVDGEPSESHFVLVILYRLEDPGLGPFAFDQFWFGLNSSVARLAGPDPGNALQAGGRTGMRFGRWVDFGVNLGFDLWHRSDNEVWDQLFSTRIEPWLGLDLPGLRPGPRHISGGLVPRVGGGLAVVSMEPSEKCGSPAKLVASPGLEAYVMLPTNDGLLRLHAMAWRDGMTPGFADLDGATWRLELGASVALAADRDGELIP